MQARMQHPAVILPDAMKALLALDKATDKEGLPLVTRLLVQLRASQINGCSACVVIHSHELKKSGQTEDRIFAVGAWREAPYFSDPERAALALTEAVTRQADRPDAVPDSLWQEVRRHYDDTALAALIIAIANINVWNRLNATIRQPAGPWK